MSEPLQITLDVSCSPEHAFHVWTSRIGTWWPADHTLSGAPEAIILENRAGGRIYETSADGAEHDWGVVTLWDPPRALGYTWHLGTTPARATRVLITFEPVPSDDDAAAVGTLIRIDHSGWEAWGLEAAMGRSRNLTGWQSLLPHYCRAVRGASIGP